MPKVYLVIERDSSELCDDSVFGVFSKKEKAMQIKEELLRNFIDHNETNDVEIIELTLDECTEDYHFFMNN